MGKHPTSLSTIPIALNEGGPDGLWGFHFELFYIEKSVEPV